MKKRYTTPRNSIATRSLVCFIAVALLFFFALFPLMAYCRNTFQSLVLEESVQQMASGTAKLENTVYSLTSAALSMKDDNRFLPLQYRERDLEDIPINMQIQMQKYLKSLVFPMDLVDDCFLQVSPTTIISTSHSQFAGNESYYPSYLEIGKLSYEEWVQVLENNKAGFLPVYPVKKHTETYDALIYSLQWVNDTYYFACMDVQNVKLALVGKSNMKTHGIVIMDSTETVLYSDIQDMEGRAHVVSENVTSLGLKIEIHVPASEISEKSAPLYLFVECYLAVLLPLTGITVYKISKFSSKPILDIIDMLDAHGETCTANATANKGENGGFFYIRERISEYQQNITKFQEMANLSKKRSRIHLLEKMLYGYMSEQSDYDEFQSVFPEFPDNYYVLRLMLTQVPEGNGPVYEHPLTVINYYLSQCVPSSYFLQLSNFELLVIADEKNFETCRMTINELIVNINDQEPCYHAWGMVSDLCEQPKDIYFSYWQIVDMCSQIETGKLTTLADVSNEFAIRRSAFRISDVPVIHSAIVHGNIELALIKIQEYRECLQVRNRAVFDMFRSILLNVRQEFNAELRDLQIPDYNIELDMYAILEQTIRNACERLRLLLPEGNTKSLGQEIKAYIEKNFADEEICQNQIADHFDCSISKAKKEFAQVMDCTITAYIEMNRMNLANCLLSEGGISVTEVAQKCGYTNISAFHKAYKKKFGVTPGAARTIIENS